MNASQLPTTRRNAIVRVLSFAIVISSAACTPRLAPPEEKKAEAKAEPTAAPAPTTNAIVIRAREGAPTHLVVLLHGIGADAASFRSIGDALAPSLPHAEFVVPDAFHRFEGARPPAGWQWFSRRDITSESRVPRVRESGVEVSGWIDAELARRGMGGERLVLVGFSQGAIVASWLAMHRTPRPAAVVMLSGLVGDTEATTSPGPSPAVFIAHGDSDDVLPASNVAPGARILEQSGARVTTRIYPGLGHNVDARVLRDIGDFLRTALGPS